jgi:hypothetical protein
VGEQARRAPKIDSLQPYKPLRVGVKDLLRSGSWLTALDNTLMPPRLAPFACILILWEVAFHLQARENRVGII